MDLPTTSRGEVAQAYGYVDGSLWQYLRYEISHEGYGR